MDRQFIRKQAVLIDCRDIRVGTADTDHLCIQIHQIDVLYFIVLQHFPYRHTVTAAEDQYPVPAFQFIHRHVYQCLMVAVLIHGRKLCIAVNK